MRYSIIFFWSIYILIFKDDEEGHPDPREVLFLIDTHRTHLDEIKMVLKKALTLLDEQVIHFYPLGYYYPLHYLSLLRPF